MGDSVPFSVLNDRLRPRFTAMERLCYSLDTLEDRPNQPSTVRSGSTTRSALLKVEPEPTDNGSLTITEQEDEPEEGDVVTEGLTSLTEEGDNAETLTVDSDYLVPSLTMEDIGSVGSDELSLVRESLITSLTMDGDGADGLTTVREGDGSDPATTGTEDGSPATQQGYIDGTLPDLIRSGRPLSRRRTLGPVSDTLKEVRREVELSRRRSLRLKAQVDKLQENRDGPEWSQHRERVTEEVLSVLGLLLPLTEPESRSTEPSFQENRLGNALIQLKNVARKLAISHTGQGSKSGVRNRKSVEDNAILQQALRDRDDAIDKKQAMEMELLRSKTEMMSLNNQLLEAAQKRLEMSLELEAWKDDVQYIIQQQLQSQQQAEEAQKKPTRMGLMRRTNKPPMQRPAPTPVPTTTLTSSIFISKPAPSTPVNTPAPVTAPTSAPAPSPAPQRTWRERLRMGKLGRHSDQDAVQELKQQGGSREEKGFHNVSLD